MAVPTRTVVAITDEILRLAEWGGEVLVHNRDGKAVHARYWKRHDGSYGSELGTLVSCIKTTIPGSTPEDSIHIYTMQVNGNPF